MTDPTRKVVGNAYHSQVSRIGPAFAALLCALTVLTAPPAHADPGPVRFLIIGDSLTLSRHGMYSWRYRLDKEFHRQGVAFDFVGSLSTTWQDKGYPTARYFDPNFDQDHYCKAGRWLRDAINGELGTEVTKQNPDVVILQLGTADVVYGDTAAVTRDRMRTAIAQIRVAKPSCRDPSPEDPDPSATRPGHQPPHAGA